MEVTRLDPDGHVGWKCVGGADEWVGTELSFDLTPSGDDDCGVVHARRLERAERIHGPLQCQVGLLPHQPEETVEDGKGTPFPDDRKF